MTFFATSSGSGVRAFWAKEEEGGGKRLGRRPKEDFVILCSTYCYGKSSKERRLVVSMFSEMLLLVEISGRFLHQESEYTYILF
jgi:hypothetical protein